MEILDVYDAQGNRTGKTIERGNKNMAEGEYIKLATIWIRSCDKYLIQECSAEKGGEFAVSGGHVPSGKTSLEQIIIEAEEELGLKLKKQQLTLLGSVASKHAIFDVYLLEDNTLINHVFDLQVEEVKAVHWLAESEIIALIDQGKFRKSSALQFYKFVALDR